MNYDADKLLALLPALYRARDAAQRPPGANGPGPLQALLGIAATEIANLEQDIARLYDNWFIETCDEWVVPYIGELIGARALNPASARTFSRRAWVANTLGYRRRKGTATMLEQLARDTTGWPSHAVEFFERLAWSQQMNHVRRDAPATASLRSPNTLELVGGAFDSYMRTVDVRSIERGRGRLNIPNVGLFLWRLQSRPIGRSGAAAGDLPADYGSARAYLGGNDGRYTFNPFGLDATLFNNPQTEDTIAHLAGEANVPGRLRRRSLHDELEARRQALVDGTAPPQPLYFDGERAVLRVLARATAGDPLAEIAPEFIGICDLADPPAPAPPPADWRRPSSKDYARRGNTADIVTREIHVAVDPVAGRLAFPAGVTPAEVAVLYSEGFPGDLGGGPYDRADTVDPAFHDAAVWQVGVSRAGVAVGPESVYTRLADALDAWNALPAGRIGVIALMDSTSEFDDAAHPVPPIRLKPGSRLLLIGADWPIEPVPGSPGAEQRVAGAFAPDDVRPHFVGDLLVEGAAPLDAADPAASNPGELSLNGLLLEGRVRVREAATAGDGSPVSGNLGRLNLVHSTVRPASGASGLAVSGDNDRLALTLTRSIVIGGIELAATVPSLAAGDSIIDAAVAIAAPGSALAIEACTLRGSAAAKTVEASNSIFGGALVAERRQTGCVRFCSLAAGSKTPRRHRCQPDLALSLADPALAEPTRLRLAPQFTAETYGAPAYLQLAQSCALEIRSGADDGAEMGAWNFLKQPQREANLLASLDEYLRLGLAAGLVYAT